MKTTEALAAVRAEQIIRATLENRASRDEEDDEYIEPAVGARAVVDAHTVQFEHRDGLRRVVLASEWEVDPAVTKVPAPAGSSQR